MDKWRELIVAHIQLSDTCFMDLTVYGVVTPAAKERMLRLIGMIMDAVQEGEAGAPSDAGAPGAGG